MITRIGGKTFGTPIKTFNLEGGTIRKVERTGTGLSNFKEQLEEQFNKSFKKEENEKKDNKNKQVSTEGTSEFSLNVEA